MPQRTVLTDASHRADMRFREQPTAMKISYVAGCPRAGVSGARAGGIPLQAGGEVPWGQGAGHAVPGPPMAAVILTKVDWRAKNCRSDHESRPAPLGRLQPSQHRLVKRRTSGLFS